jgi:hypothetical protein
VPASTATSPTTLLRVVSTPREIPDATVLEFRANPTNCSIIRFITAGVTPVGSRTITIQPYTGAKVPCKAIANIGPKDLTGRVYRAQVKKKLSDPVAFLTLNCTVTTLAGVIDIGCDTRSIPATDSNLDPFNLSIPFPSKENLQTIDATDPMTGKLLYPAYAKAIAASYYWDLEYLLNGVGPIPGHRGRFWIEQEATV